MRARNSPKTNVVQTLPTRRCTFNRRRRWFENFHAARLGSMRHHIPHVIDKDPMPGRGNQDATSHAFLACIEAKCAAPELCDGGPGKGVGKRRK
jgi:hypothetical protein